MPKWPDYMLKNICPCVTYTFLNFVSYAFVLGREVEKVIGSLLDFDFDIFRWWNLSNWMRRRNRKLDLFYIDLYYVALKYGVEAAPEVRFVATS